MNELHCSSVTLFYSRMYFTDENKVSNDGDEIADSQSVSV